MSETSESPWEPQPAGAAWIAKAVAHFRTRHPDVSTLESLLREQTGTRIADWVDHLIVRDLTGIEAAGFVKGSDDWYEHPGALLPPVRQGSLERMLLRVDSVSDFFIANCHRFELTVTGAPQDLLRTALFDRGSADAEFGVIEHHGCNIRRPPASLSTQRKLEIREVHERLRHRRRRFDSDAEAGRYTTELIRQAIDQIGRDLTCDLFFEGERAYWQARNRAGRIQYMRQQAIGVGWGNHDHHTYRSSRTNFQSLIELLELMGFQCRERFYAGRDAGWGAQVIEQPVTGVVIFADVDLSPDEIAGDFSHHPLAARSELGTIGLWCALHGEALYEAGMHHLECQFDYDGARKQLEALGVGSMSPFTDFPFLRQCFTEGERWSVDRNRIDRVLSAGLITREQAERFAGEGAVGSHMEILERNDGYRGFNQTGINDIIRKTDPRFLTTEISRSRRAGTGSESSAYPEQRPDAGAFG